MSCFWCATDQGMLVGLCVHYNCSDDDLCHPN